jgi:hypothetical protein
LSELKEETHVACANAKLIGVIQINYEALERKL